MEATGASARILIIDDDPACGLLLSRMITHAHAHEVQLVASGSEALALMNIQDFELIFCDLSMPGWDGVETMRVLSQRGVRSRLILISALEPRLMQSAARLAAQRGLDVVGCLTKPFLQRYVDRLLVKARAVARPEVRESEQPVIEADELAFAIANGQLRLHYQPQIRLSDGRHLGAEALVRWQHPTRGLLSPDTFIPLAESCELIEPLTDWVLNGAVEQAAFWRSQGIPCEVSVNLSARNLSHLDLPDWLVKRVRESGLRPEQLTLEVTETALNDDIDTLLDICTRLRLKGFPLSIDDFGTGYANLTQLRRLPFTELKLDRSFISGATLGNDAGSVVRSSVELAQRLQLQTVAEGIEGLGEWQLLQRLGVDRGQGYYIAKPMPALDVIGWHYAWEAQRAQVILTELTHSVPAASA